MAETDIQVSVNGREGIFSAALQEISFGRDQGCIVRLELDHVGPRHLLLRCGADGWTAERVDPAHGVFLRGRAITSVAVDQSLPLRLGDPHHGPLIELAPAVTRIVDLATRDYAVADAVAGDAPAATEAERNGARTRPAAAHAFHLSAPIVRLGRDPASDVVVDDLLASRRHAELRRGASGGYEIVDRDSQNGRTSTVIASPASARAARRDHDRSQLLPARRR